MLILISNWFHFFENTPNTVFQLKKRNKKETYNFGRCESPSVLLSTVFIILSHILLWISEWGNKFWKPPRRHCAVKFGSLSVKNIRLTFWQHFDTILMFFWAWSSLGTLDVNASWEEYLSRKSRTCIEEIIQSFDKETTGWSIKIPQQFYFYKMMSPKRTSSNLVGVAQFWTPNKSIQLHTSIFGNIQNLSWMSWTCGQFCYR